jgi:hypothetical protein
MPDEQPSPDSHEDSTQTEADVLLMLTDSHGRHLWSVEEVGREIESQVKASDALAALYRAGLIHRTSDGFVFATRAAIRASELVI